VHEYMIRRANGEWHSVTIAATFAQVTHFNGSTFQVSLDTGLSLVSYCRSHPESYTVSEVY
jgi:hypothetical protein